MKPGWQRARYPLAEWVPWKPTAGAPAESVGLPTAYYGRNVPIAVVLHIMQGYQRTARSWALQGFYPKSWHFSVGRDGSVMQHLDLVDGGYHAGITAAKAAAYPPTWPLWRGAAVNVNFYTIGIEHEGFAGEPFTEAQTQASIRLCLWLADILEIAVDPIRFPPHAVIDIRDRPHDFNTPTLRLSHYAALMTAADLQEDTALSAKDIERIDRLERLIGGNGFDAPGGHLKGEDALAALDKLGWSARLQSDKLNTALTAQRVQIAELAESVRAIHESPDMDNATTGRLAAHIREIERLHGEIADILDPGDDSTNGDGV